jgi:hypothetical protein
MTGAVMHFSRIKRGEQHTLGLDKATRDALADYCRNRWPANAAKLAAREWDLTIDEGRGVVAARASQSTIDKIWKHPNGRWRVIFPVLANVVGHEAETFIQAEREKHVELARRHGALVRDIRAGGSPHLCDPSELADPPDQRRYAEHR